MSVVTNVIVTASIMENEYELDHFMKYETVTIGPGLIRVSSYNSGVYGEDGSGYGGSKAMECYVYMAAFNHINPEQLVLELNRYHWREPENVLILIQEQDMNAFCVGNLGDEYTNHIGFEDAT